MMGNETVTLQPGDVWTSEADLQKSTGLTRQQVRRTLEKFNNLLISNVPILAKKGTIYGSIITLNIFPAYRTARTKENQVLNQAGTKHEPSMNHTQESIESLEPKKKTSTTPITFHDNQFHGISDDDIIRWSETYPLVNVRVEIMRMESWYETQPSNKWKNKKRGIVNWLGRTQKDNESKPPVDDMPPLFAPPTADELEALKNLK